MNTQSAAQTASTGIVDAILPLWPVFLAALLVSLVLTPVMRALAIRNGIVDWPDLKRKSHVKPVAYLGGVSLFLGWLAGVFASYFLQYRLGGADPIDIRFPVTVLFGATIITVTGLADDVFGMSPRVKIGGQFITAAALTWQSDIGKRFFIDLFLNIFPHSTPSPALCYILGAIFVTVMVVGGCNSLNLLDGLDGLAAGVSAIAAVGFLILSAHLAANPLPGSSRIDLLASPVRVVMCLSLLGAALGFLVFNFNPASIFMGDAGSLLLGYLCVSTILEFVHTQFIGPLLVMAALIMFALPITDTTLAIIRRKMRGQPIFSPDNQHLHHLLFRFFQKRGLSPNRSVKTTVLSLYALAIVFGFLGCTLVLVLHRWRYVVSIFAALVVTLLVTAYRAGHHYVVVAKTKNPS